MNVPMQLGTACPHFCPHLSPHCVPAAPRARRFSSGGEEDGYDRGMHKVSASPQLSPDGSGEKVQPSSATREGATTIPATLGHLSPPGHPQGGL